VFKRDRCRAKLFTPRRASDSAIVFQIAAIPKTNEAVRAGTEKAGSAASNRIGRRTIMCMLLIAALSLIWNVLG
jgi:hypothetical protein